MPSPAKPLSEVLTLANALIFRITHLDNVTHILAHGLYCQSSDVVNPEFVPIGKPDIIGKRASRVVGADPGGSLVDYVPFYFTPCTPMLKNIVTGWNGVRQRGRSEVVVLVSSFDTVEALAIPVVVADRNATLMSATVKRGGHCWAASRGTRSAAATSSETTMTRSRSSAIRRKHSSTDSCLRLRCSASLPMTKHRK